MTVIILPYLRQIVFLRFCVQKRICKRKTGEQEEEIK